jgi:hypothetical protein
MTWRPHFYLYASNGITLTYEFEYVQNIIGWPSDEPSNIEITNLRSQGSIIIPGGLKSYDITLEGILIADDYTALTTKIFALQAIAPNTNYILTLDKSPSSDEDIRVMRLLPIDFKESNRITFQKYAITFRALSW